MSDSYQVPYFHRDPRPEDYEPRGVEDACASPSSGVEDARPMGRRNDARSTPASGVEDVRPTGRRNDARPIPASGVEDARPTGRRYDARSIPASGVEDARPKGSRDGARAGPPSGVEDARPKGRHLGREGAGSGPNFGVEDAKVRDRDEGAENVVRPKKPSFSIPQEASQFKLVVAAIDFGTTYSGYAYGFRDELAKDFSKVYLRNWSSSKGGQGLVSQKTPTSLLLNPEGGFAGFGFDAEEQYMDLANDNAHIGYKFFRRFKMKLHNNEGLRRDTTISDDQNNPMRAIDVFAHSIRYLKSEVETALERTGNNIKKEEISWVLTIPAIWDPKSKQFMREAAEMAGIPASQLEFALEPEAASVFLKEVLVEIHHEDDQASEAALTSFPPGTKYLVLDLGGGTIDITARMVMGDKKLRELHYATGNGHGGNTINDKFFKYLEEIFGKDVMDEFQTNLEYKSDVLDLEVEIEMKKRAIESQLDSKKFLTLKLPGSLLEIFQEKNNTELSKDARIKTMKDKIEVKGDKLRLHMDVISKFFMSALNNIVEDTKRILEKEECKDIDRIMLVGGFAECKIVSNAITKAFDKMKVVTPPDPGLAVLKGAVIYRYWPEVVSIRKCPHTYGSRLMRYFLKGFDDEKKLKTIKGQPICLDVFNKFVTIGEDFRTDQSLEALEVFPVRPNDTEMDVWIFKTDAEDTKYVTDKGCTKLGSVKVKMPDTSRGLDRKVDLTLTLGHTEIVVKGKHWPDGEVATVTFDMLS